MNVTERSLRIFRSTLLVDAVVEAFFVAFLLAFLATEPFYILFLMMAVGVWQLALAIALMLMSKRNFPTTHIVRKIYWIILIPELICLLTLSNGNFDLNVFGGIVLFVIPGILALLHGIATVVDLKRMGRT